MAITNIKETIRQIGQDYIQQKFGLSNGPNVRRYPLNQDEYKASVEFTTISEEPVTPTGLTSDVADIGSSFVNSVTGFFNRDTSTDGGENESVAGVNDGSEEASNALLSHNGVSNETPTKRSRDRLETVSLYLMQQLQFNDVAKYNNIDLGIGGAALQQGLQNGQGVLGAGIRTGSEIFGAFTNGGAGAVGSSAMARLAASVVTSSINDVAGGAVRLATQTTVNPNARTLFEAPEIRIFTFTFKLIPTSKVEAEAIKSIVAFFRKEVYPTEILAAGISVGYEFPNKFEIKVKYNGQIIPGTEIADCYLTQVQTTFNPTQMGFHEDGNFNETDLTLTFRETRALSKTFFGGQPIEAGEDIVALEAEQEV